MLESIEGKRGLPRQKPPFPFQVGLWGKPTLINNVETLYWVRDLVERGPAWWTSHGRHGRVGLRSFSVSGRVKQPGVKLAPAGITVQELIDEFCGGMVEGHEFRAYLPGGASGGILPVSKAPTATADSSRPGMLSYNSSRPHAARIGPDPIAKNLSTLIAQPAY